MTDLKDKSLEAFLKNVKKVKRTSILKNMGACIGVLGVLAPAIMVLTTGEIKNLELVQELYNLYLSKPDVILEWTRGHVGTDGNEDADEWANKAREGATL